MNIKHSGFSEEHTLHELRHFLPAQTPIKDFIHHNTLHALQDMRFYDAIFKASKIFGYQVTLELSDYRGLYSIGRISEAIVDRVITKMKGAESVSVWKQKMLYGEYDDLNVPRIGRIRNGWKKACHINLDDRVHPLLFRIVSSYLDQGIALWHFPNIQHGFLGSLRELEKHSRVSFFSTQRARRMLLDGNCTITSLLDILIGDPALYHEYLFDQQFGHHGWSGMVATVEDQPDTLLYSKRISLQEFIILELLLEIDALDAEFGIENWKPLSQKLSIEHSDLFANVPVEELQEVFMLWQDAFEWTYYNEVLTGLKHLRSKSGKQADEKHFQAVFCIDERECSLRRHIEMVNPQCETLGCPGFFGVEFYFLAEGGKFYEKLCPAPVTPKYLIKESHQNGYKGKEMLYQKQTHSFFGGFVHSVVFGYWAGIKLFLNLVKPKMSPAIANSFSHMGKDSILTIENKHTDDQENGWQIGFTIPEMVARVEGLLKGIGLVKNFAPLVYLISHGSSSANNPHKGAYDCGACSGRPGAINARVFAFMANHPKVREILSERGFVIPSETQFIGGMHDTASDLIDFFDLDILSSVNLDRHKQNWDQFDQALDLNAKERSRRFASIDTRADIRKVRRAIEARSVSLFEPRPEFGHGTNALCIVGRRSLTQGLFLDRRAFMNSYDYTIDPDGTYLLGVIRPLPVVCGGINLEYYFSRVDNQKFGAGTKLPHNVMGLIGVANSSDGDLRPGLPLQTIEVHDPIRLLMIVEHRPEIILKVIQSQPELYEWFKNEWVHLISMHPDSGDFYFFRNEVFEMVEPIGNKVPGIDNLHEFLEAAREMETNHILHATKENLPVHILNH
jgi:uncharacterized protein YbcC (UPF0753/DUF2309 family)